MPLSFDFALEGFRIIRQRPKLILIWGAITLFGNAVATVLMVALSGPALGQLISLLQNHVALDENRMAGLADQLLPGMLCYAVANLLTSAVLTAAACRVALRPEDEGLGFLQFGLDEIRILVVNTVMAMMGLAVLVATTSLGSLLGEAGVAVGWVLGAGLVVWLYVRLSLNRAQTFATGRLDFGGSFVLSRGVFWPLLGGYILALLLAIVVVILCMQVARAIIVLGFSPILLPDYTSLRAYLTPVNIIGMILGGGLISPLLAAIAYGAPAAAYRALRTDTGVAVSDSF